MKKQINNLFTGVFMMCFAIASFAQDTSNLKSYFNKYTNFSGTILVSVDGKTVFQTNHGYANFEKRFKNNRDTRFGIGSLTKQFTSMGIMILYEQEKLDLSDPISKYLPDCPSIWANINIHHLLTHTSGIMHSWELDSFSLFSKMNYSFEEVLDKFTEMPLVALPSEKFHYSGVGYFLLAVIIETVSGMGYGEFLQWIIFDRILMKKTGVDINGRILENRAIGYISNNGIVEQAPYVNMQLLKGGGNMYSTVNDLLKWDQAIRNNTLINPETKKYMFKPFKNNYAYGWRVLNSGGRYLMKHNGRIAGFFSSIVRYPNEKLTVIILSNYGMDDLPKITQGFANLVYMEHKEGRI